jgi:hypothetical protein
LSDPPSARLSSSPSSCIPSYCFSSSFLLFSCFISLFFYLSSLLPPS